MPEYQLNFEALPSMDSPMYRQIHFPRARLDQFIFGFDQFAGMKKTKSPKELKADEREAAFRKLDVVNGDVIVLKSDRGARLEGPVVQVKEKDGELRVRIGGFDETPHGNHNAYFGVRNYDVLVISRTYRWTRRDKVIALLSENTKGWENFEERLRESYREHYGAQADAILAVIEA